MPMQDETMVVEVGSLKLWQPAAAPALPVFCEDVLALLQALSNRLRQLGEARDFPDIAAFAFWCRRASLNGMARHYEGELRLGRGVAFHIAPSNVPLQFLYTLAAGLLAGCANAVRLPSRRFAQAELVCRELNALLHSAFPALLPYILCFRCEHEHALLHSLSEQCSVRVMWGGDETIRRIRALPLSPRAVELPFADRYSVAVVHAEWFLHHSDPQTVVERFCQDAYFSGQWACTAPRAVLWLGSAVDCDAAQQQFWGLAEAVVETKYPVSAVQAVKKRQQVCLLAAEYPQVRLCPGGNRVVRVEAPQLTPAMLAYWTGEGLFFECCAAALEDFLPVFTERCQTVVSMGVEEEEWQSFLQSACPRGIDRIVPPGGSMQFSLHWDGVDLIRSMSRNICFH